MKSKLQKFTDALNEYGEDYFPLENEEEDLKYITGILKQQGYWSGVSYRFYFDNDLNLVNVASRW